MTETTATGARAGANTPASFPARAWAATSAKARLGPLEIRRREPRAKDVHIEILHCGVCHSDLHQVRDEWHSSMPTVYPCVAGHEIVGRVVRTGPAARKYREGDLVAVGCMVDSCRTCASCKEGLEQFCAAMPTFTYNFPDPHLGGVTFGGYSEAIVVDEDFVLRVPAGMDPAGAAPLLCAGITTWSPLRQFGVAKGQRVGVVGLGGLGHMAVKLASALGADVVLFTTSPGKAADALRLGAKDVVVSKDAQAMLAQAGTFDFVIDTVSAVHDLTPFVELLKRDGTLTMVGAPSEPVPLNVFGLLFRRRRLAGSLIGGIRETQELLDFCGAHGLTADVERIPFAQLDQAFERMLRGDVRYRFVVDAASLR